MTSSMITLYQWSKTSRARSRTLAILSFLALMMDPTQATFRFKGSKQRQPRPLYGMRLYGHPVLPRVPYNLPYPAPNFHHGINVPHHSLPHHHSSAYIPQSNHLPYANPSPPPGRPIYTGNTYNHYQHFSPASYDPPNPSYESYNPPPPSYEHYNPPAPSYEPYTPPAPSYEPYNPPAPSYEANDPSAPSYETYNPATPSYEPYNLPAPSYEPSQTETPSYEANDPPAPAYEPSQPEAPSPFYEMTPYNHEAAIQQQAHDPSQVLVPDYQPPEDASITSGNTIDADFPTLFYPDKNLAANRPFTPGFVYKQKPV